MNHFRRFSDMILMSVLFVLLATALVIGAEWTPAQTLGHIEQDSTRDNPSIVIVRDLPGHYPTQKKVVALLESIPGTFALGMENRQSADFVNREDKDTRGLLADCLLRQGQISGAQYYALSRGVSGTPLDAWNRQLARNEIFREAMESRIALGLRIEALRNALTQLRAEAPIELQAAWQLDSDFERGRLSLTQIGSSLRVPIPATYAQAKRALATQKATVVAALPEAKRALARRLLLADNALRELERLFRQEPTLSELGQIREEIPEIINAVSPFLASQDWQRTIESALNSYGLSHLGAHEVADRALQVVRRNEGKKVVLVVTSPNLDTVIARLRAGNRTFQVIRPTQDVPNLQEEIIGLRRTIGQPTSPLYAVNPMTHPSEESGSSVVLAAR